MAAPNRPTSPHLTIYRPQISTVISILHRLTGLWLTAGALALVAWLYVVAYTPGDYPAIHECMGSLLGQACLIAWLVAFYYHLCSGIRHLFWDIGKGFAIPVMNVTGWLVILATVLLTIMTWGFVQASVGG